MRFRDSEREAGMASRGAAELFGTWEAHVRDLRRGGRRARARAAEGGKGRVEEGRRGGGGETPRLRAELRERRGSRLDFGLLSALSDVGSCFVSWVGGEKHR